MLRFCVVFKKLRKGQKLLILNEDRNAPLMIGNKMKPVFLRI